MRFHHRPGSAAGRGGARIRDCAAGAGQAVTTGDCCIEAEVDAGAGLAECAVAAAAGAAETGAGFGADGAGGVARIRSTLFMMATSCSR